MLELSIIPTIFQIYFNFSWCLVDKRNYIHCTSFPSPQIKLRKEIRYICVPYELTPTTLDDDVVVSQIDLSRSHTDSHNEN